jgi:hypothetical protein
MTIPIAIAREALSPPTIALAEEKRKKKKGKRKKRKKRKKGKKGKKVQKKQRENEARCWCVEDEGRGTLTCDLTI